jgi:hypothetical protein
MPWSRPPDRSSGPDLGEVDARRLYLPAGHRSMYACCVGHRKYSEDVAYKRIRVARAARRFPGILTALGEGRLHLTAVVHRVPYLAEASAPGLLRAAEHKTRAEVERLAAAEARGTARARGAAPAEAVAAP